MAVVQTLIGNIKGPQGEQGATGATGAAGAAATIEVGSVTTTTYGNPAQITNSGTESAAVFDFVIPQGKPGEATTTMGNLTLDSVTTSTADFPTPQVGETGKVVFGKIIKFFADTVAALNTKLNTANVANNLTTTAAGYALDARQGKALNDSLENTMRWNYVTNSGNVALGTAIQLPNKWNEILCITKNSEGKPCLELHVPFTLLAGTSYSISSGYYAHSAYYGYARISVNGNGSSVTLAECTHLGNTPTGAGIYVYYR